ncbi:hypothetical protein [Nitrincola sp. A-D6]|uniref:hypothetical protein n=1 Tax=Nitrincola sp. A-D6 TaxID=1545442 RepID=UPI000691C4E8|nr:hypothetical protein [Nitrincola sp. A-D6]
MSWRLILLVAVQLGLIACAEPAIKPDPVDSGESDEAFVSEPFEANAESDPFEAVVSQAYPELPDRLTIEALAGLADAVNESSGLAYRNGHVWTHNDSGNDAMLFELSASGEQINRRVHPLESVNHDWEALAQDDDYLYIADCGNNLGDRIWIQIYKVAWDELDAARDRGVVASQRLNVRLADTQPERNLRAHNNDCEALTVVGDELWLLTKNWQNNNTRLYRLNKHAEAQQAISHAEYPVRGLITGADYNPQTQQLALIGYRLGFLNTSAFIWLLPVTDGQPDWSQASYHQLNPMGQWEAIMWHEGDLVVTRETSLLGRAQLGIIRLN